MLRSGIICPHAGPRPRRARGVSHAIVGCLNFRPGQAGSREAPQSWEEAASASACGGTGGDAACAAGGSTARGAGRGSDAGGAGGVDAGAAGTTAAAAGTTAAAGGAGAGDGDGGVAAGAAGAAVSGACPGAGAGAGAVAGAGAISFRPGVCTLCPGGATSTRTLWPEPAAGEPSAAPTPVWSGPTGSAAFLWRLSEGLAVSSTAGDTQDCRFSSCFNALMARIDASVWFETKRCSAFSEACFGLERRLALRCSFHTRYMVPSSACPTLPSASSASPRCSQR